MEAEDQRPEEVKSEPPPERTRSRDLKDFVREEKKFLIPKPVLQNYQQKFRSLILKGVIIAVFLSLFTLSERIFTNYLDEKELDILIELQRIFDVSKYKHNKFLHLLAKHVDTNEFYIAMTHFYFTMFFGFDSILCLKLFYMHLTSSYFMIMLEVLYQGPRPFWVQGTVQAIGCCNNFAQPAIGFFHLIFIFYYGIYIWATDLDDPTRPKRFIGASIVFGCLIVLYGFFLFLSGQNFLRQLVLTLFFTAIILFFLHRFNDNVDNIMLKSSIQVEEARINIFLWMIFVIVATAIAYMITGDEIYYPNIEWMINYAKCDLSQWKGKMDADNVLGLAPSFSKLCCLYILLGGVFGAAKTFRDMDTISWYRTNWKIRISRILIANLLLAFWWAFTYVTGFFSPAFTWLELNNIFSDSAHFSFIFYLGFGFLPKYVFTPLNLVNTRLTTTMLSPEMKPSMIYPSPMSDFKSLDD